MELLVILGLIILYNNHCAAERNNELIKKAAKELEEVKELLEQEVEDRANSEDDEDYEDAS